MYKKELKTPIVMCHGLFGWGGNELGGYPYFRCAYRAAITKTQRYYKNTEPPRLLFPATGPVSSLHDQACELFYQLKGGLEDYGEEHSAKYAHKRFGRNYEQALYPEWDGEHPLDFVAHSMGGPVVRMLQYLLEQRFFYAPDGTPYNTCAAWIRSITTVSGVHNGSTLAWILGCCEEDGILKEKNTVISAVGTLLKYYSQLEAKYSKLSSIFDLHLEQWDAEDSFQESSNSVTALRDTSADVLPVQKSPAAGNRNADVRKKPVSAAQKEKRSAVQIFKSITENSAFFESEDSAVFDLTLNAMEKWNPLLKEYPDTWYFSYVTGATMPFFRRQVPKPFRMRLMLFPFSIAQGFYTCKPGSKYRIYQKQFRKNDGMCPSWTQGYPHIGRTAKHTYIGRKHPETWEKGVWNIMKYLGGRDHAEVAMMPHFFSLVSGDKLYKRIFDTIETLTPR